MRHDAVADAEDVEHAGGAHGIFPGDDLSALLTADTQVLSRRIEFVRARRPSHAPVASACVRILNPEHEGLPGLTVDDGQGELLGGIPHAPGGLPPQRPPNLFASERLLGLLEWSNVRGAGPGLSNLGNTCFMNVILQALAYLPPVANLCVSRSHSRDCRAIGFCASCELEVLVQQMHSSTARVLSPTAIAQKLRLIGRHLQPGRQQDAHDFFLCLVHKLMDGSSGGARDEARAVWSARGSDASLVASATSGRDRLTAHRSATASAGGGAAAAPVAVSPDLCCLFAGGLASTVRCLSCSHTSTSIEPCIDLSLGLHKAPTVHAALGLFTRAELLKGEDQYWCPECSALVDATKTILVQSAPPVLALHLKRFRHGRHGAQKLGQMVKFDEELDLADFCAEDDAGDGPLSYRLHAAVVHQGPSLHSGHYCCYARAPSGVWHSYDDGSVQQVSAQRVLQGEAYLLFYVRVPPPRDEACRTGAPGLKNAGTPRLERPPPFAGSGGSPPHQMGAPPADEPRKALRAGLGDGPLVEETDAGIPLQAAPAPAGVMPRRASAAGRLRLAQSHVTYPAERAEGTGSSPCRPHALIAGGSGLLPRLSLLPRRWLRPGKARGGRLAPQPRRHGETPMIPRAADAYPSRQLAPSPLRREPRHAALTHPGTAAASPPPAPTGIASIGSAAARAGAPFTAGAASLFTEAVGTWDGVLLSSDAQRARREEARAANRGKRQRHYDAYEAEYDRGRLKKPLRQALAREAAAAAPPMASRARGRGGAGRGRGRVSKKY